MNIEQEIRAQIEKNKGLKLAVGEINNHLSILEGLLRNERADVQKQVNEAYRKGYDKGYADKTNNDEVCKELAKDIYYRGLDDAWAAARKIVCDEGIDMNTLCTIFGRGCSDSIMRDYSAAEVIEKLKAYEERQKADNRIEVGDEVNLDGVCFIVTRIFQPRDMKEQCDGIDDDGCVYSNVLMDDLEKTGRHFDVQKILEEMKE